MLKLWQAAVNSLFDVIEKLTGSVGGVATASYVFLHIYVILKFHDKIGIRIVTVENLLFY